MASPLAASLERPIILIISDQKEFSDAVSSRWPTEPVTPSFLLRGSSSAGQLGNESFDLAVAGGLSESSLKLVLDCLQPLAKPVICVCPVGVRPGTNAVPLPDSPGWPELVVTVGARIVECAQATAEADRLRELNRRLEPLAMLGRYLVEMRHNLNNALTSILGNSDLILLNQASFPPAVCTQVETIRNMGLRMNEIMQRFSSLQKEMQLVEEQTSKKPASKSSARGAYASS